MRFFTHPLSILLGLGLVAGLAFGQYPLAIASLVGWVGFAAFQSMRQTQARVGPSDANAVSNENRARIAPIRRFHREIAELVAAHQSSPAVKVIGAEAIQESQSILNQAVRMLQIRDSLSKTLHTQSENERERAEMEMRLASAGPEERDILEAALRARQLESEHFGPAKAGIERIDLALRQSEAALSELKTRLAVSASHSLDVQSADSDLSETLSRLKSLGTSLEEAEGMLKEGSA